MEASFLLGAIGTVATGVSILVGYYSKAKFADFSEKIDKKITDKENKYEERLKALDERIHQVEKEYLEKKEFKEFQDTFNETIKELRQEIKDGVETKLDQLLELQKAKR